MSPLAGSGSLLDSNSTGLGLADDFRKANWVELVKYLERVM